MWQLVITRPVRDHACPLPSYEECKALDATEGSKWECDECKTVWIIRSREIDGGLGGDVWEFFESPRQLEDPEFFPHYSVDPLVEEFMKRRSK